MFGELKEMKGLGYDLVPNQLMQILKDDNFKLFYTLKDDIPLCARIVYIKTEWLPMCLLPIPSNQENIQQPIL